jgi:hypothetical protein
MDGTAESNDSLQALTAAELRLALPEAVDLIGDDADFWWRSDENARLVTAEIQAARSAEAFGYHHRVEMHLRRAIEILRADRGPQRQ